ncbi:MAG: protein-glutamate O-methyltransferase CheR, partial [Methylococcaceae bacterium]|nr:protein-glutamate O-methyltransferase CheR [Methylococcaceae bacterium]
MNFAITDKEFSLFRGLIFEIAGIDLGPTKKAMVSSRLAKRLRHYGFRSYGAYFELLTRADQTAEKQILIDLLTTNETYFFREPAHFDFLARTLLPGSRRSGVFRVWSAACSTGQEAYSIAMVLADQLGKSSWEVIGTDLSMRVLQTARAAHYPMSRTNGIPREYLRRFCLQGTGPCEDTLLIDCSIQKRVKFVHANLNSPLPDLGALDVIFLRNVMIYFNQKTKREIVHRIQNFLKPGGY